MVLKHLLPNPNKTWKDVNPDLPAIKIEVLGPPPTSGTRDAFSELALEKGGCKKIKWIKALKKKINKSIKPNVIPQERMDLLLKLEKTIILWYKN